MAHDDHESDETKEEARDDDERGVLESERRHESHRGRSLRQVLSEEPGRFDAGSGAIRAARCGVSRVDIGRLHSRYLNVTTLLLCGNRIRSLRWAGSLPRLRLLSLGDNAVSDLFELHSLVGLRELRKLRLAGNPVEWAPFFRAHVVKALAGLTHLDDRPVGAGERAASDDDVAYEHAMLALLAEDYCAAHSLDFALRVSRMHADLRAATVRYPAVSRERRRERLRGRAPASARARRNAQAGGGDFGGWALSGTTGAEALDEVAGPAHTSANVNRLLQLWQYSATLEPFQLAQTRKAVTDLVMRTPVAQARRRVACSRRKRLEASAGPGKAAGKAAGKAVGKAVGEAVGAETWERAAYAAVSLQLKSRVARSLVACDRQRTRDAAAARRRPRLGAASATRLAAELEAERALRWGEEQADRAAELHSLVSKVLAESEAEVGAADARDADGFALGSPTSAGVGSFGSMGTLGTPRARSPRSPGGRGSFGSFGSFGSGPLPGVDASMLTPGKTDIRAIADASERMLKAFTPVAL